MRILEGYETKHREMNMRKLPFNLSKVVDICLDECKVFISTGGRLINGRPLHIFELTKKELAIFVFEYKKYLKSATNPDDRVGDFECLVNNSYSIERYYELRELRLTSKEKHERLLT